MIELAQSPEARIKSDYATIKSTINLDDYVTRDNGTLIKNSVDQGRYNSIWFWENSIEGTAGTAG